MAFDVKRNIIFPVILLLISIVFALSIAEVSLRILNIGYGNAPQESHPIFHHVHPAEYRFLSHDPSGEYGGHPIYYDAERLVHNPKLTKQSKNNCLIVFLGDSFTEAGQVAYQDSFVGLLEKNTTRCKVKNYGVSSYSPIFYLLQWQQQIKKLKPSLVIVQLYSNDIESDKDYLKIAIKNKQGDIIAIPGPENNWLRQQLRKSYLVRFLRKVQLQIQWFYNNQDKKKSIVAGMVEENPDITTFSGNLITSLAKEVQASGAKFALTIIPSKFRIKQHIYQSDTLQFSDKWKLFSQQNNIPFVDLSKSFEKEAAKGKQLFFDLDIHFNENGHKLAAKALAEAYPEFFKSMDD